MPKEILVETEPQTRHQPLGDWTPDIPSPINTGMLQSLNLIPNTNGTYGPERALQDVGGSPSTTPFGAALKVHGSLHSRPSSFGNEPEYYVGTLAVADGAARIVARGEQSDWVDLSKAAGYNSASNAPWRFANFGLKVLAINRRTRLQVSDGDLQQFRDNNADIRASDVAVVRGFAVLCDINDATHGEGVQPFRVWWSAIADAENFPDPISDEAISVQSGFFDLFDGGELQRIVPGIGGADAIVVAERKMWRMTFVGPPQTFQFDEIESDGGTSAPGTIAKINESFFYLGHNRLFIFDGNNSAPIGQGQILDFLEEDLSLSSTFGNQHQLEAAIDTEKECYVLSYRNADALTDNNNRILRYNWVTQKFGNSAIACDTLGYADSFIAKTDSPRIVYLDSSNQIRRPSGSALEITIEGAELTNDQGDYIQVQGLLPYTDSEDILCRIATRDNLFKNGTVKVSTERGLERDGFFRWFDEQPTGRFYQCRFRIPAGSDWTNITGMLYDFIHHSAGPRRVS